MEYLLLYLHKHHFFNIVLCTGYQSNTIEEYFGSGEKWKLYLTYSREENPMGTAGALRIAKHLIEGENFLVLNGDTFFDIDLNYLVECHEQKRGLATMALTHVKDTQRYGFVETNNRGEIMRFLEKTDMHSGWINGGIYVFHHSIINYIPNKQNVSLEREIFPNLIGKGFYGLSFRGWFVDIGTQKSYLDLQVKPDLLISWARDG